jgi:hypothetical protein
VVGFISYWYILHVNYCYLFFLFIFQPITKFSTSWSSHFGPKMIEDNHMQWNEFWIRSYLPFCLIDEGEEVSLKFLHY